MFERKLDQLMSEMKLDPSTHLVPTNVPGVFSKVWTPGNGAKSSSIASLIHSSVLAGLMESDSSGARTFRERILSRDWRPEDQVQPSIVPRIGVTHELTGRRETVNSNSTSSRWAGGVITGGPWSSAFGIWRVPSVNKPSTPPGTSGGWESSSWVGIDGGSNVSTDVLQAGVDQNVSSGGDASYAPWFEWFIPANLVTPSSPAYVYALPIDNIRIEPGDEVFCGVYYVTQQGVGRQGELIFGNVDRGHYFSMVLAPPTGASFNGRTAEWIMEAPNSGEPGTSIPSFTPLVFSTAFSIGQNNTTGDPLNGDTRNIVAFGEVLTSVAIRQDVVEIDYIGSNWQHNLPSSAPNAVPVAPGTSPTSWYTTPENVQHIAYVGNDARIHELFYRIAPNQSWQHNLPSSAPNAVPVAPGTSPTSWFTTPENVQHIAYVGNDARIHELFYRIAPNQSWQHNLPSNAPNAVPVAPGTSPTSWYTTPENVQHIAYVGNDARIHELFYRIAPNQSWQHNLPSNAPNAVPVAPGTSPTSWYTTPENVQHIAYVGNDARIHELFYRIAPNQSWQHNLPSNAPNAVPVAPGTSPTSWYTTPENVQHIAYVGNDARIHELFYRIAPNQSWQHNLPSNAQGAVPVAPKTSPTSWYTTPENVQHIAYVGSDELIHELFYRIGANQAWLHNLPSAASGAVPVALGTSPTSWYTTPENVQHIAHVGNDARIHELFFRIG